MENTTKIQKLRPSQKKEIRKTIQTCRLSPEQTTRQSANKSEEVPNRSKTGKANGSSIKISYRTK